MLALALVIALASGDAIAFQQKQLLQLRGDVLDQLVASPVFDLPVFTFRLTVDGEW